MIPVNVLTSMTDISYCCVSGVALVSELHLFSSSWHRNTRKLFLLKSTLTSVRYISVLSLRFFCYYFVSFCTLCLSILYSALLYYYTVCHTQKDVIPSISGEVSTGVVHTPVETFSLSWSLSWSWSWECFLGHCNIISHLYCLTRMSSDYLVSVLNYFVFLSSVNINIPIDMSGTVISWCRI